MNTRSISRIITGSLFFAAAFISLTAVVTTFSSGKNAQAQTIAATCGLETLRGSYVIATHGWNISNGAAVPKAIVEEIEFNGDGTLIVPFATVSINGSIIHASGGTGTYTLQSNCTGTLTFSNGPSFDIVVDPPPPPPHQTCAKQIWMIQTGPAAAPAVFEGIATRVSR